MAKLKYKDGNGQWQNMAPSQKEFDDFKTSATEQLAETAAEATSSINYKTKLLKSTPNQKGFIACNIIGDSISHGANAPNMFDDSWTAILRKALQIDFNTKNHGFMNLMSPISGSVGTFTDLIYFPSANALWTKVNTTDTLGFFKITSSTANQGHKGFFQKTNKFFKKLGIGVIKNASGGTVDLKINGTVITTLNLNKATEAQEIVYVDVSSIAIFADLEFVNKTGTNTITGLYFMDDTNNFVVNNYSRSGARIEDLSDSLIDKLFDAKVVFFCLGHNYSADTIVNERLAKCVEAYNKYKPILYVVDLVWDKSRLITETQLKNFATQCNSPYIKIIDKVDNVQTLIDSGFISDVSHPTVEGHRLIAEKILATAKTTFLTKSSIVQFQTVQNDLQNTNEILYTGKVRYTGEFDKSDPNYSKFKDIKMRLELIPKNGYAPTAIYFGQADATYWALYDDPVSASSVSGNLPRTTGTHQIKQASWNDATKPFDAMLNIGEGSQALIEALPINTRIKFINPIVTAFTTRKTNIKDLIEFV